MYSMLVVVPFMGSICVGLFGFQFGRGSSFLIVYSLFLVCLLGLFSFYEIGLLGNVVYVGLWEWFSCASYVVWVSFTFDSLVVYMLLLILPVGSSVLLFSVAYMSLDYSRNRFMFYFGLFIAFMIVLVSGSNYVVLFVGWEGVGLCSYLLVGFWFLRDDAVRSANQAMILNRLGDIGLIAGIGLIIQGYGSTDYSVLMHEVLQASSAISICLFIGAVGKSAQIGLHLWLANAMEGPSPVSALMHAATMVTAGVYMLVKSSWMLDSWVNVYIIALIGSFTALLGALIGMFQTDLKRVIAYSTVSQLGYMVIACGLGEYQVVMAHLLNHGVFKALLFLSAGGLLHSTGDDQDTRFYGESFRRLPVPYLGFTMGSFSLCGFPYTTGYYSKDLVVAYSTFSMSWLLDLVTVVSVMSAAGTVYYSLSTLHFSFVSRVRRSYVESLASHEGSWMQWLPVIVLSVGGIGVGFVLRDAVVGMGSGFWGNCLADSPVCNGILDEEEFSIVEKLELVAVGIVVLVLYDCLDYLYVSRSNISGYSNLVHSYYLRRMYYDGLFVGIFAQWCLVWCYDVLYKNMDKGCIEVLGNEGLGGGVRSLGSSVLNVKYGSLRNYVLVVLVGTVWLVL